MYLAGASAAAAQESWVGKMIITKKNRIKITTTDQGGKEVDVAGLIGAGEKHAASRIKVRNEREAPRGKPVAPRIDQFGVGLETNVRLHGESPWHRGSLIRHIPRNGTGNRKACCS